MLIPLSRYQMPHLIWIPELLSFLGLSFVCFFSCKFGRRFPRMLSLEQTENGKASKPWDTLRFSQENSKNCHVQATCPLGFFLFFNRLRWLRKLFSNFIELYVWVCVCRSHPRILSLCYWKWQSYNNNKKKNHLFFFYFSLSWMSRLLRWSSTIRPPAVSVSRNRPAWPWKVLSGERSHNSSSKRWTRD